MSKSRTNPFTTNERKALKEAGWTVLRQHNKTVIRTHIDLDFGDGDTRTFHARIKKMGPIMFTAEIEKTAPQERFRTIEEALQHIEDRKTVILALGVMDPSTRPGRDVRVKTWLTSEWAKSAAEVLQRARNLRKHLR